MSGCMGDESMNKKRNLILMTAALTVLVMINPVYARSINGKPRCDFRPAKEKVVHHSISTDEAVLGGEDSFPSSFTSDMVTEVNDQGHTGCCWAFSNTSAMEASYNTRYKSEIDFSWKNLAYYAWHKNTEIKNPSADDYNELIFKQDTFNAGPQQYDYDYPQYGRDGGNYTDCVGNNTAYLFAGGGSYSAPILYYRGLCFKEETGDDAVDVDLSNIESKFGNAGTVGTSVSDAYRIKDALVVSSARSNMNNIKALIQKYGAGAIAYYANDVESPYVYNPESLHSEFKREYDQDDFSNHAITIIGWDDTIPASKFQYYEESGGGYGYNGRGGSEQPEGDGGWICLNSWGNNEKWTENGKTYISYYDASLTYADVTFYDVFKKGDPDGALLWADNTYSAEGYDAPSSASDSKARGLAMKADKDMTLTSVSIFSAEDNASYTLSVYGNPKADSGSVSMQDNTPVLTQKVSFDMAGIHTVSLDQAVGIKSGQTVLVALKPDKSVKQFYSKKTDETDTEAYWDEELGLYMGHVHGVSSPSGMSLVEQSDNKLVKMSDGDVYLQLLSNDGIADGVATFEGSDFDMSKLNTGSGSGSGSGDDPNPNPDPDNPDPTPNPNPTVVTGGSYTFDLGSEKYEISWTNSVPYTGCAHALYGTRKKNTTPDIQVSVKKNGQELSRSDYKVKFKNNKYVSGYKGKYPELYIKLSKNCGKQASKALKAIPLGFEIRKCNLSKDLDLSRFDVGLNRYGDRVTKLYDIYDKTTMTPVKLKLSKDGYKGDIIADIRDNGRDAVTVTLQGINNCTGTASETFEVEWY